MPLTLLGLVLASCPSLSFALSEAFTESLQLKPLSDGKVSAHFEFTTTLYDASPRSPTTLEDEDDGAKGFDTGVEANASQRSSSSPAL